MIRKIKTAGTTLIELMTYMAVFGVISSTIYTTYYSFLGYLKKENRQIQLLIVVEHAQELMMQDVRCATALPSEYASYKADASTLICTLPLPHTVEDETPGSYVVIYTRGGQDGKSLVRKSFSEEGNTEPDVENVLLKGIDSLVFEHSLDGQDDMVRFTITAPKNTMYKNKPTVYSFVAVRRND